MDSEKYAKLCQLSSDFGHCIAFAESYAELCNQKLKTVSGNPFSSDFFFCLTASEFVEEFC